ncbi:MAG: BtaA family protein, partial [Phycisphaeraceae bacterium]|nr:BtaA family protein [Phycisphaeraceae bacterium]
RMFTLWFNGFVYNQIWEDPRVDAQALQLDGDSRILTISSGGCNVLNYLVHQPAQVVAVDLNACHIALTRLKIAAIKNLPTYDDFYSFFGMGNVRQNLGNYERYIRDGLDDMSRQFWESRQWLCRRIGSRRISYFARGFYDSAKLGQFLRVLHGAAKLTRRNPQRLLDARTMEEQRQVFQEDIASLFSNRLVRAVGKLPVSVFSLGIPPSQHSVMKEESGGRLIELYQQRLYKLACGFPMEDNYFAWQAFGRRYDHERRRALPDYLRQENHELLRRSIDRVQTHNVSLIEYLKAQPAGALNRFVLLDSQDWMPAGVIAALWEQIHRVGGEGARIIFRTAGERSPVEAALPPSLRRHFVYEETLSRQLHEQDRSAIYGMFHVYHVCG